VLHYTADGIEDAGIHAYGMHKNLSR